jgi:predicted Fe-S protein YdhL (DUF1289 family)
MTQVALLSVTAADYGQPQRAPRIMHAAIDSPCSKICALDPAGGLCRGCGRTLAEIAAWTQLSAKERQAVMALLAERLARLRSHDRAKARPS